MTFAQPYEPYAYGAHMCRSKPSRDPGYEFPTPFSTFTVQHLMSALIWCLHEPCAGPALSLPTCTKPVHCTDHISTVAGSLSNNTRRCQTPDC